MSHMNNSALKITGTFIDEVSHDIPSWNWGEDEWDKDFAAMKAIGIDTVVMIRCGSERWTAYPSKVLEKYENAYRPPADLIALYLRLAEKYDMKFFCGTYHANRDWLSAAYNVTKEADLMKRVCDEIWSKYGNSPAFGGWYLSQEIAGRCSFNVVKCFQILGKHCHEISNGLPTFISPGIEGSNTGSRRNLPKGQRKKLSVTPEEHYSDWDWIMGEIKGAVDIVSFQNAHVTFEEMPDFMAINKKLADKHGLTSWTNLESFDICTPSLPPIKWQQMLMKMEFAKNVGFEKAITFEFSHFMSPNSCYPQAGNLYKRYCEHFGVEI